MADRLELFRGISQAIANSYDGAHDERYSYDGEERKIGLKREEYHNKDFGLHNLEQPSILEWYDNGIKKLEGYWINGFKDGKWEYWYDSGKILKEEIHENGKMKIEKWY